MTEAPVLFAKHDCGAHQVILNRPEVHNAFDDDLIARLTEIFRKLDQDDDVRCVFLRSEGKNFSAGADLNWMRRMADYSRDENLQDARGLAEMLAALNTLSKPVVGLIQGAAFGGAVGLVACCDIVVAAEDSSYCLSEVKLGIIPAVISPYVVSAMGGRAARRYFLTAERFNAEEALRLGLVHEVVARDDLDPVATHMYAQLAKNGPQAIGEAKALIRAVDRPIDEAVIEDTAQRIARVRASDEGKEGIGAFLEKRKPSWVEE